MNPYISIVEAFELKKGDIVLVASNLIKLVMQARKRKERFQVDILIDCLISAIGQEGTLLFPTYNWDYCNGVAFDYHKTISKTGSLSNAALKREDFLRTKHPIYSFAVWGKDQEKLVNLQNKSAFGKDSPFAYLHKHHAKMIMIDVDYQNSFTFVHYAEEMAAVTYRYMKEFTADYIDENNQMHKTTYSMLVRNLDMGVQTKVNPIGEEMEKKGVATVTDVHSIICRVVDLNKAYGVIMDDIESNASNKLYSTRSD
ncbi:aminoglycoside N(3)-acetyltransferase [Sporosarcina sp. PTS2304]|uniref:AAC(3) family N-acetyltransferase n=1 Tax=Sporosarcina sp. PTS2304 TaxID=2283194 RepID=UPI000E0DC276|nr:AAC(3) family N-acetyltransferase [Sporosarcina sp. PTS2304]AXH98458.1 aminoglycoside N(3)-acetyltransferase [Sporosarcina sp. PTS2304]